ncbi:hypothetical protein ADK66_01965 [Micromonospora sp. NRRL B-16802]|uniref:hypothetical protein n=1 Tax=Micromonospora TaxID=1873 RepID=UPI0006AD8F98|nr:hypothetical protein [Micromonospora sp. NRRL B-16802]KOX14858.1 hypothetical protein ADK66_01965 [Micromonospora sp. NRRL B-16802]
MSRHALLRTTVVALAAVLAAGGCSSTATSSVDSTATTVPAAPANTPSADAGTVIDAETPNGDPTGGGSTSGGGSTGGQPAGGTSTGGDSGQSGTKASGPIISYFRVTDKPRCPAGTSANPIAGGGVLMEWRVSNVKAVALSIDGAGVYRDDYPSAGSEEFAFPCSGGEGDIQKHTYTLTARNAHGTQTKTIVVTAPVHDIPQV